jgi:hypothetical protein
MSEVKNRTWSIRTTEEKREEVFAEAVKRGWSMGQYLIWLHDQNVWGK